MSQIILPAVAILAYFLAWALILGYLERRSNTFRHIAFLSMAVAIATHLAIHYQRMQNSGGMDLQFFAALSAVTLVMSAVTLGLSVARKIDALLVVTAPLAILAIVLMMIRPAVAHSAEISSEILLHAWLALAAYSTLSIASLLAVMLAIQERVLRSHPVSKFLNVFPPLTMVESMLFQLIAAGLILLTLTLLSGAIYVEDLFAQHLVHKTVLSCLAWIVFAALLFGRFQYGWRGRRAIKMTLIGMAVLLLAFFGSKFVLELILQR